MKEEILYFDSTNFSSLALATLSTRGNSNQCRLKETTSCAPPFILVRSDTVDIIKRIWPEVNIKEAVSGEIHQRVSNDHGTTGLVEHEGLVINYSILIRQIKTSLSKQKGISFDNDESSENIFTINAEKLKRPGSTIQFLHSGLRKTTCLFITLKQKLENKCFFEAGPFGWLFFFETGQNEAFAQIASPLGNISEREIINILYLSCYAAYFDFAGKYELVSRVNSYPYLNSRLISDNWISIGKGAMGFDPICGDGSGWSLKSAVLASATIKKLKDPSENIMVKNFYRSKKANGYSQHLMKCIQCYEAINKSLTWDDEINLMKKDLIFLNTHILDSARESYMLYEDNLI